ncbi:MAG TPA: flagellar motor protein MotB [Terracidiphilus sp.]|nr:flagellar motor protein MotB [Terracidiphilus sp.]
MAARSQTIVVVKKKGGHGGHHGGAWKVAYADFVTAMMALFIVLWLMSSSEKVKKAVAGYFNDPKGTANLLGTTMSANGVEVTHNDDAMKKLKQKLEEEIKAKKELEKLSKQIEITITPEGLRIELIESRSGTFYQSGSARLSDSGQELLALLAGELKTLPNNLLIEGHTDAAPYSTDADYSNWELSADRANSARRLMQEDGVRTDQVTQIRGYADQLLRVKDDPYDPSNRRISILVKNQSNGAPPQITQGQVVGDGAGKAAPPAQSQATATPSIAPAAAKPVAVPASASKPEAGKTSKTSLMGKLTAMLPTKKR